MKSGVGSAKYVLITVASIGAVGMLAAVWLLYNTGRDAWADDIERLAARQADAPEASIGRRWDWDPFRVDGGAELEGEEGGARAGPEQQETGQSAGYEFDVVMIYESLAQVELTEDGELVIDDRAREALERGFARLDSDLAATTLAQLQDLIRAGLPGRAGQRVAEVVGNYHRYRQAENEFKEGNPVPAEPEAALDRFEALVELRYANLGHEVAEQLYGEEQAHTRFSLEAMRVERDSDLSEEEKARALEQLREESQVGADQSGVVDTASAIWQDRFAAYERERQAVLGASLSEADQSREIENLLAEHFEPEEIPVARYYDPEADRSEQASPP